MNRCVDRRMGKLLHAYELGTLAEEQRQELETHLIRCPYCAQRASDFLEASGLLRRNESVRTLVNELASGEEIDDSGPERRGFSHSWLLSFSLAIAAILILVLVDWQIIIRPSDEAVALENRLTVFRFASHEGDLEAHRTGKMTSSLLITGLAETGAFRVTSRAKLHAILADMGGIGGHALDPSAYLEAARRSGAKWALTGEVLAVEPVLLVTSQLVDVMTGDVIASQRVVGKPSDAIFTVVDSLSAQILRDLSLMMPDVGEAPSSIAEITTKSPEAYQHFLDGLEYSNRMYSKEAVTSFRRALSLDSTMAMAYFYLAKLESTDYINSAMAFRGQASKKQRFYIESLAALVDEDSDLAIKILHELLAQYPDESSAYSQLGLIHRNEGRIDSAIVNLSRGLQIDPYDRDAMNRLAYAYRDLGDLEQALVVLDRYVRVAAGEPNPFDTRGDIYASLGFVDAAIESYQEALSRRGDFHTSRLKLGVQYLAKHEFAMADSCFEFLVNRPDFQDRYQVYRNYAASAQYQGQFEKALALLDTGVEVNITEERYAGAATCLLLKSWLQTVIGRIDEAINTYRELLRFRKDHDLCCEYQQRAYLADLLFGHGEHDAADRELDAIDRLAAASDTARAFAHFTRGNVSFRQADWSSARAFYDSALQLVDYFDFRWMLARSSLEMGKLGTAEEHLEYLISEDDPVLWASRKVACYYYLGRVYEASSWNLRAAEQYEKFIRYWGKTGDNLEIVEDAVRRYNRLQSILP